MGQRPRGPVLVVEDNAETREVLFRVLAIRGHDVVTADDGLDALGYLRTGAVPSVIVLDMRMPNYDGHQLMRALKADARWADIPVVIFSAFPPEDAEGAVAVVRKGTDSPDVLLAAVGQALKAGR